MGANNGSDMRPSLITGMRGDTANNAKNNPTVTGGRPSTSTTVNGATPTIIIGSILLHRQWLRLLLQWSLQLRLVRQQCHHQQ